MHEIDGAYVRVSVVGCVSHTLCPLTEDFELFVCHVLEFFRVLPVTLNGDGYVIVRIGHGVYPSFVFACICLFDILKPVDDVLFHVLEI